MSQPLFICLDFGGVITDSPFPVLKEYSDVIVRTAVNRAGGHVHLEKLPTFLRDLSQFSTLVDAPGALHLLETGLISRTEFVTRFKAEAVNFVNFVEGIASPAVADSPEFHELCGHVRKSYDPTIFTPMVCSFLRNLVDGESFLCLLERCALRLDVLHLIGYMREILPQKLPSLVVRTGIITNNWESEYLRTIRLTEALKENEALQKLLKNALTTEQAPTFLSHGHTSAPHAHGVQLDAVVQSVLLKKRKPQCDIYFESIRRAKDTLPPAAASQGKLLSIFLDDLERNVKAAVTCGAFSRAVVIKRSEDVLKAVVEALREVGVPDVLIAELEKHVAPYKGKVVEIPTSIDRAVVAGKNIPSNQLFSDSELKKLKKCLADRLPSHFLFGNLNHNARPALKHAMEGLIVEYFKGGMSNPTYRLTTRTGSYVLRKQPKGKLLKGAHDVAREYKLFTFLQNAPRRVPVPHALGFIGDVSVLGTPFYVMRYVPGHIMRDTKELVTIPAERGLHAHQKIVRGYFEAALEALAALHAAGVPHDMQRAARLPKKAEDTPIYRLATTWERQYLDGSKRLTEAGKEPFVVAEFEQLTVELKNAIGALPLPPKLVLCHGDYKFDNMMFDRRPDVRSAEDNTNPELLALLDFELAAVGDPLTDVAYFTLIHYFPPPRGVMGMSKKERQFLLKPAEILERYCELTGAMDYISPDRRAGVFAVYQAAQCHKMAGIVHGVICRSMMGNASDVSGGLKLRPYFEGLSQIGLQLLEGFTASSAIGKSKL